jgi:HPt (histidine-containing phosphotransfer) domain-containing protein
LASKLTTQEEIMGVLDPAALENLRETVGGDVEFMVELMNTFLEDAPRMLTDMDQALQSGDATVLRRSAHSLKSNSAEFGAMDLSELCRELEALSKDGSIAGAEELVGRIKAEFSDVKAALEVVRDEL